MITKKIKILIFACVGLFLFAGSFASGANVKDEPKDMESSRKWEIIRGSDKAVVSGGWKDPSWLGDVNTPGWEDGAYISGDGNSLYFAYINIDLLRLPKIVENGPLRDTQNTCKPPCGKFPRVDLFYTSKDAQGQWPNPLPHPLTVAYPVGGITFVNADKAYFMMEKNDGLKTEICFSEKINDQWQPPQKIEALSSRYKDDDPWVSASDDEMFFWSDRPAEFKGNNIYYSKKVNGAWQKPVILPEPINSNSNDMQPFLFGDTLYFTSDRDGRPKIYSSVLTGRGWATPEVVVSSKYGVGEPTLTSDGKYLYFVQIFMSDKREVNPDIMFCQKD